MFFDDQVNSNAYTITLIGDVMNEETEASIVVGHIYEASYKPEYWSIALEHIAAFTNSHSAALLYQDNEIERAGGSYIQYFRRAFKKISLLSHKPHMEKA